MRAVRFGGYRADEWPLQSVPIRARVMADYMEHTLRESYAYDQAKEDAKREANGPEIPPIASTWRQGSRG